MKKPIKNHKGNRTSLSDDHKADNDNKYSDMQEIESSMWDSCEISDLDQRKVRADKIFEMGLIRKITRNRFGVDSQRDPSKSYTVKRIPKTDTWSCECRDFYYRLRTQDDKRCKHILACMTFQDEMADYGKIEKVDLPKVCPKCFDTDIIKAGFRNIKGGIRRQIHKCRKCSYRFNLGEQGFSRMSSDPEVVSQALTFVMNGTSYRKTAENINVVYNVRITHSTVSNWVQKYAEMIKGYVDVFLPELGDVWSLDEMEINVKDTKKTEKGFRCWLWNIIDPKTRFLITTLVTKRRETGDAKKAISWGKKMSRNDPLYILTDKLNTYTGPIYKEFLGKVAHIRTRSIKDGFVNRPVERYHNETRETTKARRGLGNEKSAQAFADLHRIHHNYVRKKEVLGGRTPAQAAGIDLELGPDKYLDLIKKAGAKHNFVTALGKRIELVNIDSQKDSIKVTTKAWIKKKVWREINDILRLYGFAWLSNGRDSCWIKPVGQSGE